MKNFTLLLSAALFCGACQSELTDTVPNSLVTTTPTQGVTVSTTFPQPDGAIKFNPANPAEGVWQILQKIDLQQTLQLGETEITPEQYAEIKKFVDENLKEENDYKTYLNIFQWIVKNMTYANDLPSYLKPYDVFIYRRCVCQGYANLLKTMCLTQGIPCFVANGYLNPIGGHAWNYVYAGGKWIVSDPTNNKQYDASNLKAYAQSLIPQRMDFELFSDEHFTYNFQNSRLNVSSVKNTNDTEVTLPYSIAGFQITSFSPNQALPSNVQVLNLGANIETFGDYPESITRLTPNIRAINIDPNNTELESENGIVYNIYNREIPYIVPGGIRSITLRPMKVVDKNTLTNLDNLEELIIANGTERIESYAIEGCSNLRTIYVPETVTYIADDAFYRCGNNYQIVNFTTGINEVRR